MPEPKVLDDEEIDSEEETRNPPAAPGATRVVTDPRKKPEQEQRPRKILGDFYQKIYDEDPRKLYETWFLELANMQVQIVRELKLNLWWTIKQYHEGQCRKVREGEKAGKTVLKEDPDTNELANLAQQLESITKAYSELLKTTTGMLSDRLSVKKKPSGPMVPGAR